jgi:glucosyl-3-phosphoglycerate synthase
VCRSKSLCPAIAATWLTLRNAAPTGKKCSRLDAHAIVSCAVFHHCQFSPERLAVERAVSVSVCVPARNERAAIGPIVEGLMALCSSGVVDQVVVVDDSDDGTGEIAAAVGAEVHRQADLRPEQGPVLGKGDAMWRALSVLSGDVICFLDADTESFSEHFTCGLIGPLLDDRELEFVKGLYRRPFRHGAVVAADGGGRVTELTARPLLSLFYPELAGFRQPLAGEIAARRSLLERLPFSTGYGVDLALLIGAWRLAGLDALAQVDLDVRQNAHQRLDELGSMAYAVLKVVAERLSRDGRLDAGLALPFIDSDGRPQRVDLFERPPFGARQAIR